MKQKIVGIAGSMKQENSSSEYLLTVALESVQQLGIDTEMVRLRDFNIIPCEGCGNCMNNLPCHLLDDPGDQLKNLYVKLVEADGFIFSSPVYALSLPAQWKNWIDRCEPCSAEDLAYEYYNYDRVVDVKGKALKGKVAGLIAVAAGPGHEWALASLLPPFTAVKLSVVASVGVSLIEYDGQPGIRKQPWSKPIIEAEFAKMMARAVGIRVATALNYSTFDVIPRRKEASKTTDISSIPVFAPGDQHILIKDIASSNQSPTVFIIGNQLASQQCKTIFDRLKEKLEGKGKCYVVAAIGPTPGFITRDFVKDKVGQMIDSEEIFFDWDNQIAEISGQKVDKPLVFIYDSSGKQKKVYDQVTVQDIERISQYVRGG